jgi:hypothetical protein
MNLSSKLKRVVENLELDLEERLILTEAATGAYVVRPVIAALRCCGSFPAHPQPACPQIAYDH